MDSLGLSLGAAGSSIEVATRSLGSISQYQTKSASTGYDGAKAVIAGAKAVIAGAKAVIAGIACRFGSGGGGTSNLYMPTFVLLPNGTMYYLYYTRTTMVGASLSSSYVLTVGDSYSDISSCTAYIVGIF